MLRPRENTDGASGPFPGRCPSRTQGKHWDSRCVLSPRARALCRTSQRRSVKPFCLNLTCLPVFDPAELSRRSAPQTVHARLQRRGLPGGNVAAAHPVATGTTFRGNAGGRMQPSLGRLGVSHSVASALCSFCAKSSTDHAAVPRALGMEPPGPAFPLRRRLQSQLHLTFFNGRTEPKRHLHSGVSSWVMLVAMLTTTGPHGWPRSGCLCVPLACGRHHFKPVRQVSSLGPEKRFPRRPARPQPLGHGGCQPCNRGQPIAANRDSEHQADCV